MSILAAAVLIVGTLAAPPLTTVTVSTFDAAGTPIGSAPALLVADDRVVAPAILLFGATTVTVEGGGRTHAPTAVLLDGANSIVRLTVPGLDLPEGAGPPVYVQTRSLPGAFLRRAAEPGADDAPDARWVGLVHVGPAERPLLYPLGGELPLGTVLVDAEGRLAAYVADAGAPAAHANSAVLGVRPEAVAALAASAAPGRPMSEWPASAESAEATRIVLESPTAAELARAIDRVKGIDPGWGARIDPALSVQIAGELLQERGWGVVQDLIVYAGEHDLSAELVLRFELFGAFVDAQRRGDLAPLVRLARGEDEAGAPEAAWATHTARALLGVCLLQQGNPKAALPHLRSAAEARPADSTVLRAWAMAAAAADDRGSFLAAAEMLRRADWSPAAAVFPVWQLTEWERLAEAGAFARSAEERWPDDPEVGRVLAHLAGLRGEHEEAFRRLSEAAEREPTNDAAWSGAFRALDRFAGTERLAAFAERWLAVRPTEEAYAVAAGLLLKRGASAEALTALEGGKERFGTAPHFAATHALALLADGRAEEAWAVASAGAEANPGAQDLWLLAASIAKNTGRWEACASACEHVLEHDSLNGPALAMLAAAQRQTGDADAAERTLRQLETVSPERARELRKTWASEAG